ncbi:MAG: hypothetical protein KME31_18850 [Tolypothrix carrinoi HA7290-LM1]|nr:hypothetical protein [Tolypothrix carrinoi HA7290-LM1]
MSVKNTEFIYIACSSLSVIGDRPITRIYVTNITPKTDTNHVYHIRLSLSLGET